jgi:hypothetical protein
LIQLQANETLIGLESQGFIEVAGMAVAPAAAAPAAAPARPAAPPAPPARAAPTQDLKTVCRDAVRELNNQVGPMAEALAMRMERARNFDELVPLLESAAQVIDNTRGTQASTAFRARFLVA